MAVIPPAVTVGADRTEATLRQPHWGHVSGRWAVAQVNKKEGIE